MHCFAPGKAEIPDTPVLIFSLAKLAGNFQNLLPMKTSNQIQQRRRRLAFILAALLTCCSLVPNIKAVSPAPDGGYPGGYEAVNAVVLNEFLKEHRKVQQQEQTIEELKNEISRLAATVKEQATQLQKVTNRLDVITPEIAADDH
jgi:uncharacterized coiled-coil protein SlyX